MQRPETSTTHHAPTRRHFFWRLRHVLPMLVIFGLLVGLAAPAAAAPGPGGNSGQGGNSGASADAAKLEPSLAAAVAKNPKKKYQVIVQAEPVRYRSMRKGNLNALGQLLREKDDDGTPGRIRAQLSLIDGYAVELTGRQITKLSKHKTIRSISGDHKVQMHQAAPPAATLQSMNAIVAQAPSVWTQGAKGQGVTVAVLDSGVVASPDLPNAVHGIDLVTNTTALGDPGGHGTHVAGIVAGTGAQSNGAWKGVAPQARVLSVKVVNDAGAASYSSIIKGLQWVVANRQVHNIRVANLSLGAAPVASYKDDPLAAAAELAWFSGIVVVTSAGNKGESGASTITVPATDPYVITVGATNDQGTNARWDDSIATWSSRGPTAYDNLQKPDVVASGSRVVSIRSSGSYLEQSLGLGRVVDTNYFRLSGTSMAAPVVAGVAALVIAANPALTPNQVKYIIKATARKLGGYGANAQGAGQVDAAAAVEMATSGATIPPANVNQRPSNVLARAIYALASGAPVTWRDPNYLGRNWSTWSWDTGTWDSATWENLVWENIDWINASWSSATWDSLTGWSSGQWESGQWESGMWESGTWESATWDSGAWESASWDTAPIAD
jgi:serine protease AprX